ncbi:MAG: DUF2721 domain-containing protein [Shewanella sp.]
MPFLAYNCRLSALVTLMRNLSNRSKPVRSETLKNLHRYISIIRHIIKAGVMSFTLCILSMIEIGILKLHLKELDK